mmetsp:Transcript_15422/g.54914  ORF Transcript_15422/g.54914 Transcript_15422/m.54914 type:complete len:251 (+) Transcript_15422:376-1128(+)
MTREQRSPANASAGSPASSPQPDSPPPASLRMRRTAAPRDASMPVAVYAEARRASAAEAAAPSLTARLAYATWANFTDAGTARTYGVAAASQASSRDSAAHTAAGGAPGAASSANGHDGGGGSETSACLSCERSCLRSAASWSLDAHASAKPTWCGAVQARSAKSAGESSRGVRASQPPHSRTRPSAGSAARGTASAAPVASAAAKGLSPRPRRALAARQARAQSLATSSTSPPAGQRGPLFRASADTTR